MRAPIPKLPVGRLSAILVAIALLCAAGCADDSSAGFDSRAMAPANNSGGSTGVGQSGAQDFGRFRTLVEQGEIPAPSTLDAVGFFNEHKFELPPADCGDDICLHGMFGVQGNMINGSNCTTVAIGFNTPHQPDDFQRPPLNMAIAIDTSGSMHGASIDSVRQGLQLMADELAPKDEVALVTYSNNAQLVFRSTPENDPDRAELKTQIANLSVGGSTNIYDGLKKAAEQVTTHAAGDRQNRVILLSDGLATAGITHTDRIINLGASYAQNGVGLTTIGVGREFDLELMRKLSEAGAGNFYFIEDLTTVEEVFVEEISSFMVPLAEDVSVTFDGAEAYRFRAAYGTRDWMGDDHDASIYIPAMFMASRQSIDDIGPGGGRRGGGGVILLELVPTNDPDMLAQTPAGAPVGDLTLTYRKPGTEDFVEQTISLSNPLAPGETPAEGEFENFTVEKAFVTLNIYAGFKMATDRASHGAPNAALNVLVPLAANVEAWLAAQEEADADIEADLALMYQLIENIEEIGGEEEVGQPPNPWPSD
ncbi:vWA domain-containing protein [Persicimonas caeni]|nr:VWA domain-containing protein [Persicimonas caeni]